MITRDGWIAAGIVALALLLRLAWLDVKPVHFDEGVNGWFVDQMTRTGYYHYDPANFHGPLHFYVLHVAQTLLGREAWVLRLPIALVSAGCVVLMLAYQRYLDRGACQLGALAMAVSPGMVFYGRYAIHETWLLFFIMLAVWGVAGLRRGGTRGQLWAAGIGITGMVLTKETYIIHLVAFGLALPALVVLERFTRSSSVPYGEREWTPHDLRWMVLICFLALVFFYSGGFLAWGSIEGLVVTFSHWAQTGTAGDTGHEKEWSYFLELIARYEWPVGMGLLASLFLLQPRTNRLARYLAIAGVGTLIGYSIIDYKTPWCLIVMVWPFYFVFGLAVLRLREVVDRWTINASVVLLFVLSLGASTRLNFRDFTDEDEPYVYVQTLPDVEKLLAPLRTLVRLDPVNYHLSGHVITPEHHPLPWLLGDFTRINLTDAENLPESMDADFLLIDDLLQEEIEPQLTERYFREPLRVRGNAADSSLLYLREKTFRPLFPRRPAEFIPEVKPSSEGVPQAEPNAGNASAAPLGFATHAAG